jgi:hypothetical protein
MAVISWTDRHEAHRPDGIRFTYTGLGENSPTTYSWRESALLADWIHVNVMRALTALYRQPHTVARDGAVARNGSAPRCDVELSLARALLARARGTAPAHALVRVLDGDQPVTSTSAAAVCREKVRENWPRPLVGIDKPETAPKGEPADAALTNRATGISVAAGLRRAASDRTPHITSGVREGRVSASGPTGAGDRGRRSGSACGRPATRRTRSPPAH